MLFWKISRVFLVEKPYKELSKRNWFSSYLSNCKLFFKCLMMTIKKMRLIYLEEQLLKEFLNPLKMSVDALPFFMNDPSLVYQSLGT